MHGQPLLPEHPPSARCGDKLPTSTITIRGVSVLIANQAAHATRFGYFPVSSTGFLSFYSRTSIDAAELERHAVAQDKERTQALARVRDLKARGATLGTRGTPVERFTVFLDMESSVSQAIGMCFLAPPADQAKLLREIAMASHLLERYLEPGYAAPYGVGPGWTEQLIVERATALQAVCGRVGRLLPRLGQRPLDLQAWSDFVGTIPNGPGLTVIVPSVVRAALKRHQAGPGGASPLAEPVQTAAVSHAAVSLPAPLAPAPATVAAVAADAVATKYAMDRRGQYSLF